MNCINTHSVEFQTKLKQSGLSEFDYSVEVSKFFNKQRKMGVPENELRFPELDRVDGADSSQYLIENIKMKNDGANIQDILNYTKSSNIEEATVKINDKHRDLEVNILPLNNEALITIEHRPNDFVDKSNPLAIISKDKQALVPIFNKLAQLYGIQFNYITTDILLSDPMFQNVTDAKHTNAFVLNGQIFINMDVADVDAPIHEIAHILLGSIKFQNPTLYESLVNIAEQLPRYSELARNYNGRVRSDINEEIFVTELAKFASNKQSIIEQLPVYIQEEILYNIKRLLDSMLMGDVSVKTIPTDQLLNMSLCDMAKIVNSYSFHNVSRSVLDDAQMHRMLNNKKAELIKNNELKEECI